MEHQLRSLKIKIPSEVNKDFPQYGTLRVAYNSWHKAVYLYLIPKNIKKKTRCRPDLVASLEASIHDFECADQARNLASDEKQKVSLLKSYLKNGRKHSGEINYVKWEMPEKKWCGNPI